MGNANIQGAAIQAGLNPKELEQVSALNKILDSHRALLAMPEDQAKVAFASKPQDQQVAHAALFGGMNPIGWLGDAAHYLTQGVKTAIAAPFKALNEVSDFMTRIYRTGAIAVDQGVDLGKAFQIANDNGNKVFSPGRIDAARKQYGADTMSVAMKVASGTPLDSILANGTDAEKQVAASAAQGADKFFQDALDAAQAAKYSPGRQIANLLLPGSMEGSGALYKGISGFFDASYRIFADPTLALGKAKKAYDVANYALFKIAGSAEGVDRAFSKPGVVDFFNAYGPELDKLSKARKEKDVIAAEQASTNLRRLAPEFGPTAQDEFIKAGVKDAPTARNYLQNHADISQILQGQAARKTPLIPRLDLSRKARVTFLTTADKVFNINQVGQKLVSGLYGDGSIAYQDITTGLNANAEAIAGAERQVGKLKQDGAYRLSFNQIAGKIDRFAAKFTSIPYFKDGFFDTSAPNASTQVYRLARLSNTRYHSRIVQEAFQAGDEGQRKQIFTGLWNTIAETRGVSKGEAGQTFLQDFAGTGAAKQYAADVERTVTDENGVSTVIRDNPASFDGEQLALFPYQLSPAMAVPSIQDLSKLPALDALYSRMFGQNYRQWSRKMTDFWVIGTLAGPKFPVRNAAEDLMMHAAAGDSTWGIVKGRFLSTKIRQAQAQGDLGFIQKLVSRNQTKEYAQKISDAVESGSPDAARKVMAEAVLNDSIVSKLDPEATQILSEIAHYGNLNDTLKAVSEGGKNALRGGDQYLNVSNDVSRFGKMGAIEVDGVKYKASTNGEAYTDFNPVANKQSRISWLVQLGITSNDYLAKIAVKNLDKPEVAIAEMTKYLDELPTVLRNRFQSMSAKGITSQQHAERAFQAVQNLYSKADGTLNTDLWNKVARLDKSGNRVVSTADLRLSDLPHTTNLAPKFVHGPTLVPVSEASNPAAGLIDRTWDYMGEANSRFSREPAVLDAMIRIRKDMISSNYDKHYMDLMTAGKTGDDLIKATEYAKAHLVSISEDMAKQRILAYVDNPAVRSQLAFSVTNFARFYRATEDFYRRVYRTVKYNPEALTRASLTYEGIAHSGFVQTDDAGNQYFFYPGLTPVYTAMNKMLKVFGVKDAFKTGIPIDFGAQLKMITPSLNPDSLFPTFSGPLAAVPIKAIGNIIPQVKDLEQYLTGTYGPDQPMISAVLPGHVNRLLAALSTDERNSQFASAARKAATYLEASGHGLDVKIDPKTGQEIPPSAGEIADYQNKLQGSTMTVLALRFLMGFVSPATPSVTLKSDMANWVKDNQRVSYKQVFNNLINQYNGDIDKATKEWLRLFPKEMPYTVSETESTVNANVRAVTSATDWIKTHKDVLKKYPEGGAYLIPQAGKFDFNAYKLLQTAGLKTNKTLTDFVRQVASSKDVQTYYDMKDKFDQQMAMTLDTAAKRQIRDQWTAWSDEFKGARPLLQEQLGTGSATAIQRTKALNDLRLMLADKTVTTQQNVQSKLREMLSSYDAYVTNRDFANQPSSNFSQQYKDALKISAKQQIQNIAQGDPSTLAAFNTMFAPLLR